ncbi:MAG TPA: hypothetical protein VKK79_20350, partial [Candidatus Lokiarchaeia archaeon]|nr:hypothetical protein [Candidatus Lokiarchaeia archaeon]
VPLQLPGLRVKYWQFNHPQETLIDEDEVHEETEIAITDTQVTETLNPENENRDEVLEDSIEILTKPPEVIPACFFCGEPVRDGLCTFCAAWVCPECGTLNHSITTQCTKCLKYREKKTA